MEHFNLVYRGAHSNTLYTCYFDGTNWHGNTTIASQPGGINATSTHNPSSVLYNNWLYIFYKASDTTDLCCAWYDGAKWNGGVKISQMNGGISPKSNMTPNATVYNGLVYLTYLDPSSHEVYTAWFDGSIWSGNKKISDQNGGISPESTQNPAIISYKNHLHIIYTGRYFSDLYTATFDGITWSGNTKISNQPGGISPQSSYTPGVTVFNDTLYIAYLGSYFRDLYTATFDGTIWAGNTKISSQPGGISPASYYNPDMDVYRDKLYLAYRGSHFTDLYTATFDGTTWAGNTKISNQPGGISPSSSYNPGASVSAAIPGSQPNWMSRINDTTPIGDINIPGSHDAAAINSHISTLYACHNYSITQQLDFGIRLLDVRLQINEHNGTYTFITCHSNLGSSIGINTYQSFPSLLEECKTFLAANTSEVILMSLKVDDWANAGGNKSAAYAALQRLLSSYPVASQPSMPTLGDVRGKIFLFNRMNQDIRLGVPIGWPNATPGTNANPSGARNYNVYVQDKYEGLPLIHPTKAKYDLVTAAFGHKQNGNAVLNFASATWYAVYGVYVMPNLLNYFGKEATAGRPSKFGWTLFDYGFNKYNTNTYGALDIVSLIIDSNFGYAEFPDKFEVNTDGKDEL